MEDKIIDEFLSYIKVHGYTNNGSLFLQDLSKFLADLLNVNYIIIDKFSLDKSKIASVECFYSRKEDKFFPVENYMLAGTPCENVINNSTCCYIGNVSELFPDDKILLEENISSYIGIPLWGFQNEPIGLIAVMDNSTIIDNKKIQKLLEIAALKVEKVLEKIISDENIENSKKHLLESQHKLFQAEKLANLGSYSLDPNGGWESNEILDEIIGIDSNFKKNLEGLLSIVHPNDRDTVFIDMQDTINNKIEFFNKEYRIIRFNDKQERWINTSGKLILNEQGNPFKIIGSMLDVTSIKRNQEELIIAKFKAEENEKRLYEAQKIAGLGTYSFDIQSDYWDSSKILNDIFGIDSNYIQNLEGWLQLVHPKDKGSLDSYLKSDILINHNFFDKQYRIIRPNDNEERWVHGLGKLVFDDSGNPTKLIGTIQDISSEVTIQKELERAKREAEESQIRFKLLIEQAGDALYLHDLEGAIVEVNKTSVSNSGYSREELLTMNVRDLDIVHHNLDKLKDIWKALSMDSPMTIESFHKRKNGSIYPIEIRICSIYLNGEKLIYGFARDISERITLFNENKLLSAAVDQSANSIVITNINGNIEFVNPKFTDLTGYKSEEVLGKNPRILNSGLLPKEYYKNLWDTILNGKIWKGEFQNKSKFGDLIWERTTINPIKDEEGKITNFLAIKEDITEQKKAEEELEKAYQKIKESEDYLRSILQTANEGFWIISTTGITTDVNIKMCDILGYSEDYFLNRSIFDFVDEENSKIFKDQIKLRNNGLSTSYEIELIKKNGDKAICLFKTSPIYNKLNKRVGSFALVTDITNLKVASEKLQKRNDELNELSIELYDKNKLLNESKNRYVSIFNHSPISILEEDFSEVIKLIDNRKIKQKNLKSYLKQNNDFLVELIQGIKILKTNTSCLQMFGVKNRLELIEHLHKTNNKNSYTVLMNEICAIYSGESEFVTETEFFNVEGEKINAFVKLAVIDTNGKAIATIIDITNIKKTESELRFAKEKAEDSNRLKTEFINNMSHEIRTPMNGILGFSELLSNEELSPDKRNYFISIIQNSGKQLLRVIDDILEISRLGTKQVKVIESKVCLNDLLLELFSIFNLKAKENGVPLYIKNQLSDYESTIYTDKSKLQKIISNLIENAIKFTSSGTITFGYEVKGDFIEIFVKDTGVGIKLEKQHLIFERFSQEEKDYTRNASGLGLGLSIAKENTELLGGTIIVESEKWKGSIFRVKIPYKRVEDPNSDHKIPSRDVSARSKHKVLIVEDEEVNYLFIEILLLDKIKLNCEIIHATNGKEAVEIFNKNNDIDFILMDINMPIMNGYLATTEIKKINPKVPIIAQTAYSTPEDKAKAFEAGCNDFISKPINKDQLKEIIDSFLVEVLK